MKPVDMPLSRPIPFTSVDAHFAAGYFRISNPSPFPSASKRGQSRPWQNQGASPPAPAPAAAAAAAGSGLQSPLAP